MPLVEPRLNISPTQTRCAGGISYLAKSCSEVLFKLRASMPRWWIPAVQVRRPWLAQTRQPPLYPKAQMPALDGS